MNLLKKLESVSDVYEAGLFVIKPLLPIIDSDAFMLPEAGNVGMQLSLTWKLKDKEMVMQVRDARTVYFSISGFEHEFKGKKVGIADLPKKLWVILNKHFPKQVIKRKESKSSYSRNFSS